jgi:glucokinase
MPAPIPLPSFPVFGFDIGGTKCAAAVLRDGRVEEVVRVPTGPFEETFARLMEALAPHVTGAAPVFGVSCGGPLDAGAGVIVAPPNLPASWHGVPITARITERCGGRAFLMNDANACALAEWQFGTGRGTRHMIFLTSGTGLGSGLILNGQLFEGATGDAGEIGHVRLRPDGPVGYNKAGSAEGFYSGAGIARLAESMLAASGGPRPAWASAAPALTTKVIADAAKAGDATARAILHRAGESLGETLAILIDLFNPERIVIGGFFPHCRELLEPGLRALLEKEALPLPLAACTVVPSALGETIGSHGAIALALHHLQRG